MLQPQLDLSKLVDFVRGTLRSTEEAKRLLEAQCEEAEFALKPWVMETVVTKEVDQNSCTCERVLSAEDSIEEIAAGIGTALVHAQQLREKLAANVSRERKKACEPKVQEIYAAGGRSAVARNTAKKVPSLKNNPSPLKTDCEKENGCANTAANFLNQDDEALKGTKNTLKQKIFNDEKVSSRKFQRRSREPAESTEEFTLAKKTLSANNKSPASKSSNAGTNLTKFAARTDRRKSSSEIDRQQTCAKTNRQAVSSSDTVKSKSVAVKKLLKPSAGNTLAERNAIRAKPKKNFIAANKSSIKNIKPKASPMSSKSTISLAPSSSGDLVKHKDTRVNGRKSSTLTLSSCTASSTEIEKLISRISLESQKTLSRSCVNLGRSSCPLHGENPPKFIEERIRTTVDAVEGLDKFGMPQELVKALKVYHNHLQESLSEEVPKDRRSRKAVNKFLQEFTVMSETRRDLFKAEPLVDLTTEFIALFKDSHDKSLDFIKLSKLKIRYTDLDSKCKFHRIKSFSPAKRSSTISESNDLQNLERGMRSWRNNAIWNDSSIRNFEGMARAQCIRYSNKSQLVLLVGVMQEIQRLEYQRDLIDLLIQEVLPTVNIALDPTSEEFIAAYKMIKIISKVMNLTVPVLVRTDV